MAEYPTYHAAITKNLLTCQVCLDVYKHPRVLPCLHCFCTECIQKCLVEFATLGSNTFPCPVCRTQTAIPDTRNANSFKTNFFLQNLQDALSTIENAVKKCENCVEMRGISTVVAESQCLECRDFLCEDCVQAHKRTKLTKSHRILSAAEIANGDFEREMKKCRMTKCDQHSEDCKVFCLDCQEPICCTCKITQHNEHKATAITDRVQEDKETLKNHIERIRVRTATMDMFLQNLDEYSGVNAKESNCVQTHITKREEELNDAIKEHIAKLKEKLLQVSCQEEEEVISYRQLIHRHVEHLKEAINFTQHMLKYGSDGEVVAMCPDLVKKLKDLQAIPCVDLVHKQRLQLLFEPPPFTKSDINNLCGEVKVMSLGSVFSKSVTKGVPAYSFDCKSSTDEKSCLVRAMAVTYDNILVVLDQNNSKIKMFNTKGNLIGEFSFAESLRNPIALTLLQDGKIAILDEMRGIRVFSCSGRYIKYINSHTKAPVGICRSGNLLYVSDRKLKLINVVDHNGELQSKIPGYQQTHPMLSKPCAVSVNKSGDIAVADLHNNCVKVLNGVDGHLLAGYGTKGTGTGNMNLPISLCIDDLQNILVADYYNHRVHLLSRDAKFITYVVDRSEGLHKPTSIVTNNEGLLLVAKDTGNITAYKYLA